MIQINSFAYINPSDQKTVQIIDLEVQKEKSSPNQKMLQNEIFIKKFPSKSNHPDCLIFFAPTRKAMLTSNNTQFRCFLNKYAANQCTLAPHAFQNYECTLYVGEENTYTVCRFRLKRSLSDTACGGTRLLAGHSPGRDTAPDRRIHIGARCGTQLRAGPVLCRN
jgi:hypothetical protein